MDTLGTMLRRARLAQKRDLADVADQIKVNPRYLEALETDDLSGLPGGFFYKSFVRQYASILGVDAGRVEHALAKMQVAQAELAAERDNTEILREIRPLTATRSAGPGLLIFNGLGQSVGVLILVVMACGGFYTWWHHIETLPRSAGGLAEVSRVLPPDPEPTPTPAPSPTPTPPPAPTPTPAATEAAPSPTPEPAQPGEAPVAGVRITVSATQESWIRVWTDGKPAFTGVLKAEENRTFEGVENARLRTGNASGLAVVWNGKPVEMPGTDEFVRDVVFTPEGVHEMPKPTPTPPPAAPAQPSNG